MSNNFVVRHSLNSYADVCRHLSQVHDFVDISTFAASRSIKSNWYILLDVVLDTLHLLKHLNRIKNANIIFCVGYIALPMKLFVKLGLIECRKLFWFGFFIHSPKWFPFFRLLTRLTTLEQERYIVFSMSEIQLYNQKLRIPLTKLCYIPYGNWSKTVDSDYYRIQTEESDYYFAGGASNRDYALLVDIFRNLDQKLVIVCSATKNKEMLTMHLPPNIRVMFDIGSSEFDKLIRGARACIVILKHNTGASGQSVMLRYMKEAKAIIASDADVIREYVEDGVSGVLVRQPELDLPHIIREFDNSPQRRIHLGTAARKRYETVFSHDAVISQFTSVVFDA